MGCWHQVCSMRIPGPVPCTSRPLINAHFFPVSSSSLCSDGFLCKRWPRRGCTAYFLVWTGIWGRGSGVKTAGKVLKDRLPRSWHSSLIVGGMPWASWPWQRWTPKVGASCHFYKGAHHMPFFFLSKVGYNKRRHDFSGAENLYFWSLTLGVHLLMLGSASSDQRSLPSLQLAFAFSREIVLSKASFLLIEFYLTPL